MYISDGEDEASVTFDQNNIMYYHNSKYKISTSVYSRLKKIYKTTNPAT